MAITEVYVDPAIAADSGAGTVGDPYGDLEYCLEQITPGTDGDRINIKAGTAEVLEFALDIVTDYGTPTTDKPLVFQGYTSAAGDGGIGEINNGGANISIVDDSTLDFVSFIDLKMGNCGTSKIIDCDRHSLYERCEIWGSSHLNPFQVGQQTQVSDCYFHTWTNGGTTGEFVNIDGFCVLQNCFIDAGTVSGDAVRTSNIICFVSQNIIKVNHVSAIGIFASSIGRMVIENNTIYNQAAGTGAGILHQGSLAYNLTVRNNIVQGWSGVGGKSLHVESNTTPPNLVIDNIFCDNETNAPTYGSDVPFRSEDNTEQASGVLTDPDNDDFTVDSTAKEKANPQVFRGAASSTNKEDAGACQRLESGGGAWGHF